MLIESYSKDWLDRLNPLCSDAPGAPALYLLIDGVFIPGLYRLIDAVLPAAKATTQLFEMLPGCNDEARDVSPFLVSYEQSNSRLQRLLERCSGWPMISAVATPESQADLTERLAAWCVVESGGQRFNFRFPDTRRLPAIFTALTPAQRAELVGPAVRWSFMGRGGSWKDLQLTGIPSATSIKAELDDRQFAQLIGDSEGDEVIAIMENRGHQLIGLRSQRYANVCQALRVASKFNLDQISKLDWCETYLMEGVALDDFQVASRFAKWKSVAISAEHKEAQPTEPQWN